MLCFVILSSLTAQNTMKDEIYKKLNDNLKDDFQIWKVKFDKDAFLVRFEKIDILYEKGSSNVNDSFKVILSDMFPRYISTLIPYKKYIKEIKILGHTSSENSKGKDEEERYNRNLILSQERAENAYNYILNLSDDIIVSNLDWLQNHMKPIGKSSSSLIYDKNGKEDKVKSRRLEILIEFNDSIMEFEKEDIPKKYVEQENQNDNVTLKYYTKRFLRENPIISEQYQYINSVKQDIEIANAAYKPTVTLNYSKKKYKEYDDWTSAHKNIDTSKDITIKYNIFNGFRDKDEININIDNFKSVKFAKEQIEEDTVYTLAEAYITALKVNEFYELSRENYKSYLEWSKKAKIRFQNGLTSLKDYSKIEARTINRFMNFEEDTKRYNDTISTLQKYLDFNDEELNLFTIKEPKSIYFDNVLKALDDCVIYSPYTKEAEQNVKLYKSKYEKSKMNFYPTIDLTAKRSQLDEEYLDSSSDRTTKETSLSLELKLELYSGGKDLANKDKKFYEYKQKIEKREAVIRDVKYKVDLAYNKFIMMDSKHQYVTELVAKREQELIAANYDFKFAKIDSNGLLDVMDSLYNAQRLYIESEYDYILSKYEVLKEIGIVKEYILDEL